jgi:hypothetical protein
MRTGITAATTQGLTLTARSGRGRVEALCAFPRLKESPASVLDPELNMGNAQIVQRSFFRIRELLSLNIAICRLTPRQKPALLNMGPQAIGRHFGTKIHEDDVGVVEHADRLRVTWECVYSQIRDFYLLLECKCARDLVAQGDVEKRRRTSIVLQ